MTNTQPTSPAAPGRTRLGWVLGLTSTAYFMVVLDSSVVLTALPRIQRDLHASLTSLQWTVNGAPARLDLVGVTHGRIADGDSPQTRLERRIRWSPALDSAWRDGL